ncbi:MAG: hypothetical protein ACREQ5_31850 [Candidatus Dormibacteria bacterium]
MRRLLDRTPMDAVAHRIFWERTTRALDRIAAERPDDTTAQRLAADARATLDELRSRVAPAGR